MYIWRWWWLATMLFCCFQAWSIGKAYTFAAPSLRTAKARLPTHRVLKLRSQAFPTAHGADGDLGVQPASWSDLQAISRILVSVFRKRSLWFPVQCLMKLDNLQQRFHTLKMNDPRHEMLVAVRGGSILGFADIDGSDGEQSGRRPGDPPRPFLSDLAVSTEQRRQGVGTAIVRACEDLCVQWGFDRVYLKADATDIPAMRFYESLNFTVHTPPDRNSEVVMCSLLLEERDETETDVKNR
ncbi:unnamed protein product [Choristocarpus tenellus]